MKFSVKKEKNNGPVKNENKVLNNSNLHTWYTESNYDLNSSNNSLDSLKTCTITIFDTTTYTDLSDDESEISFLTESRRNSASKALISKEIQCNAIRCDKSLDTADITSQDLSECSSSNVESQSIILETEIGQFNYDENPWEERKSFQKAVNDKIWNQSKNNSNELNEVNILYKLLQKQSSNTINQLIKNVITHKPEKLSDLRQQDVFETRLKTGPEIELLSNFEERYEMKENISNKSKPTNHSSKASCRSIGNMKNSPKCVTKSIMTDGSEYHRIVDRYPLGDASRSHFIQKEFYKANCVKNLTYSQLHSKTKPQKSINKEKLYIPPNKIQNNTLFKTVIHCKGEKLEYEPRTNKSKYINQLNDSTSCPQLWNFPKNPSNNKKKQIKVVDRFVKEEPSKRKIIQNVNNNKIRPNTCINFEQRKLEYFKKQKAEQGVYPSFIPISLSKDDIPTHEANDFKFTKKMSKPSKMVCPNLQNSDLDQSKKSSCILSVKKNNMKDQLNLNNNANKLKYSNDKMVNKELFTIKKSLTNVYKTNLPSKSNSKNKLSQHSISNIKYHKDQTDVKKSIRNYTKSNSNFKNDLIPKNNNNKINCLDNTIEFKDVPSKKSFIKGGKNNLKSPSFNKKEMTTKSSDKEIKTIPKKRSNLTSKSKLKTLALKTNVSSEVIKGLTNKTNDAATNPPFQKSVICENKECNTDVIPSKEQPTDVNKVSSKIMKKDTTPTNITPTAHKSTECKQYYVSVESLKNKQLNISIGTNSKVSKDVETTKDGSISQPFKSCGTYITNKNTECLNIDPLLNKTKNFASVGSDKSLEKNKLSKRKKLISYPVLKNNFKLLPSYIKLKAKSHSHYDLSHKEQISQIINVDFTPESKNLLEKLSGLLKSVHKLSTPSTNSKNLKKVDKFTSCTRQVSFTLPPKVIETNKEVGQISTNVGNNLPHISGSILKYKKANCELEKEITTSNIRPEIITKEKDSEIISSIAAKANFYVRPATADLIIKDETSCFYHDVEYGLPFKNERLTKKYITSRWFSYRAMRSNDSHFSKRMMEIIHKRGKTLS